MNTLKKRLIGVEDIAFDTDGVGVCDNYETSDGRTYEVKRLNASVIPITSSRRVQYGGALNVDEALSVIKKQVDSFASSDIMDKDIVIEFSSSDTIDDITAKISSAKKNLGGHTLEILFPSALNNILSSSILFEGFTNGRLIVRSSSEFLSSSISDIGDAGSLFVFRDCICPIEVRDFTFIHKYSLYSISAENCLSIVVKNCSFIGYGESYGLHLFCTNGVLSGCTFDNDKEVKFDNSLSNELSNEIGKVNDSLKNLKSESDSTYLKLSGGTMTGDIYLPPERGLRTNHKKDMFIIAGEDWRGNGHIVLRGQESGYNPGGVSIGVGDGVSNRVLHLWTDGKATWDGKDITLGYPNYAAEVYVGNVNTYTAQQDGWIFAVKRVDASYWMIKINNKRAFASGGSSWDVGTCFLPVKKGDVVKSYNNWEGDPGATASYMHFYPNR